MHLGGPIALGIEPMLLLLQLLFVQAFKFGSGCRVLLLQIGALLCVILLHLRRLRRTVPRCLLAVRVKPLPVFVPQPEHMAMGRHGQPSMGTPANCRACSSHTCAKNALRAPKL